MVSLHQKFQNRSKLDLKIHWNSSKEVHNLPRIPKLVQQSLKRKKKRMIVVNTQFNQMRINASNLKLLPSTQNWQPAANYQLDSMSRTIIVNWPRIIYLVIGLFKPSYMLVTQLMKLFHNLVVNKPGQMMKAWPTSCTISILITIRKRIRTPNLPRITVENPFELWKK